MVTPSAGCCDVFEAVYVIPKEGRTLIVGSQIYREKPDRRKRHADALGIDMLPGPGVDRVLDLEEPLPGDMGQFDHVECCSVLEHSRRPWLMAANIENLLKPYGTLFVTVPFCWRIHAYPDDHWRITPSGLRSIFPRIEWNPIMLGSGSSIYPGPKIPTTKHGGLPYFARTETLGFGRKV